MINNNIIILNRGDTYQFELYIDGVESPSELYRLSGDDTIYFGIMDPHQPFEEALVKKRFTEADLDPQTGLLTIVIEPEDTLDLFPGTYYYAVKLHMNHSDAMGSVDRVSTVINRTKLFLCE